MGKQPRRKRMKRSKRIGRVESRLETINQARAKAGLPAIQPLSTDIDSSLREALQVMQDRFSEPVVLKEAHEVGEPKPAMDAAHDVQALTTVLNALTSQQSDRAKARIMNFVKDYFDENHGH